MTPLSTAALQGWAGGVVLAAAVVHLGFARRVDLGPGVVALGVAAWLLAAPVPPLLAALSALAAVLSAVAWWRGTRAGVGRPELTGLVLAVAAVAAALVQWLPEVVTLAADRIAAGAAGAVLVAGVVAVVLARERPGLVGQRVYHWREVPVEPGTGDKAG